MGPLVLPLASLLGNIFTNLWGTHKATSSQDKATQASIDAQLEAARLQKQAADDQLAYLRQTDARDYRDWLNREARDRTDWEASEQRKAPFRALADSAVRTLGDYIRVPGMQPAQEVPVPHWTAPNYDGASSASAPVNTSMPVRDPASGGAAPSDPRAFVQSLLPNGASSPQDLAAIEPQLNARGITLQRNSAGDIRGRVYLPSNNGDPYSNFMDVFTPSFGGGGGSAPASSSASSAPVFSLYGRYSRRPSSLAQYIAT